MALTPIQKALKAGRATIKAIDGRLALLTRGIITVSVKLTIGETRAEEIVENDMVTTIRVRDYLIDAIEYNFGQGPVPPMVGDRITIDGKIFQVLPTDSEPEYRISDRDGDTWRVHTKAVN